MTFSVTVPDTLSELTPFVLREQEDWFERELPFLRTWLQPALGFSMPFSSPCP